jgi:hypothetical protein
MADYKYLSETFNIPYELIGYDNFKINPSQTPRMTAINSVMIFEFRRSRWQYTPSILYKFEKEKIVPVFQWASERLTTSWEIIKYGPLVDSVADVDVVRWYLIADTEDILEFKFAFPDRI